MAKSPPNGMCSIVSVVFAGIHHETWGVSGALNWKKKMDLHHQTWGSNMGSQWDFHGVRAIFIDNAHTLTVGWFQHHNHRKRRKHCAVRWWGLWLGSAWLSWEILHMKYVFHVAILGKCSKDSRQPQSIRYHQISSDSVLNSPTFNIFQPLRNPVQSLIFRSSAKARDARGTQQQTNELMEALQGQGQ